MNSFVVFAALVAVSSALSLGSLTSGGIDTGKTCSPCQKTIDDAKLIGGTITESYLKDKLVATCTANTPAPKALCDATVGVAVSLAVDQVKAKTPSNKICQLVKLC